MQREAITVLSDLYIENGTTVYVQGITRFLTLLFVVLWGRRAFIRTG